MLTGPSQTFLISEHLFSQYTQDFHTSVENRWRFQKHGAWQTNLKPWWCRSRNCNALMREPRINTSLLDIFFASQQWHCTKGKTPHIEVFAFYSKCNHQRATSKQSKPELSMQKLQWNVSMFGHWNRGMTPPAGCALISQSFSSKVNLEKTWSFTLLLSTQYHIIHHNVSNITKDYGLDSVCIHDTISIEHYSSRSATVAT